MASEAEKNLARQRINQGAATAEDYKILGLGQLTGEAAGLKPSEYLIQLLEDATGGQLHKDFINKYVTKKGLMGSSYKKKSKFQKWKAAQQETDLKMLRQNILREDYGDYPIADENKRNSVIKQLDSMIERAGGG